MLSVSVSFIYIYPISESWVLFRLLLRIFMMCANENVHFGLKIVFVCLHITLPHYHHYAEISEDIELLNACQVHSVECVSKIKSIISIIFHHIGRWVFWAYPFPFVMIVRIRVLNLIIIIESEVWTIYHCLGLCHETMVCAVCLSMFLCSFYNRKILWDQFCLRRIKLNQIKKSSFITK